MTQRVRGVSGPIVFHGRVALLSGLTTGMAANAPIFSCRWATALYLRAALTRLTLSAITETAFTTAQEISAAAYLASGFTASDTGGTASIPVAGQNSLLQVVEGALTSAFTDIRIATTAALGAGTRVLDTIPFKAGLAWSSAQGQVVQVFDWNIESDQRMAPILQGITPTIGQQAIAGPQPPPTPPTIPANAQGVVINSLIAQGAVGVVKWLVEMEWDEFATNAAEVIG